MSEILTTSLTSFLIAAVVVAGFVLFLIREAVVFGSLLGGIKNDNNCSFWIEKKLR